METGKWRGRKEKEKWKFVTFLIVYNHQIWESKFGLMHFFNLNIFKKILVLFGFCHTTTQISLNYTYTRHYRAPDWARCATHEDLSPAVHLKPIVCICWCYFLHLSHCLPPDCFRVFFNITGILLCDQILSLNVLFK